ncbi:MAG TPA: type II toxin-antitoxin system RelE/ParE family toxin [Roseiarcus sp.]|nr:type II toxin-antitoxin system RelE/ParE family toxin [Roseiarcus sp.]
MLTVVETVAFSERMSGLNDARGRARILARVERIRLSGHLGDAASVGGGVSELRIHFGPGRRVYFCRRGVQVVILLGGGDKGSQARDIRAARALAKEI